MKSKINRSNTFLLNEIKTNEVEKETCTLKLKKAGTQNNFCKKFYSTARILQKPFNETLRTASFPYQLEFTDKNPVFKKSYCLKKDNYRPVSVLLVISKILERLAQNK